MVSWSLLWWYDSCCSRDLILFCKVATKASLSYNFMMVIWDCSWMILTWVFYIWMIFSWYSLILSFNPSFYCLLLDNLLPKFYTSLKYFCTLSYRFLFLDLSFYISWRRETSFCYNIFNWLSILWYLSSMLIFLWWSSLLRPSIFFLSYLFY